MICTVVFSTSTNAFSIQGTVFDSDSIITTSGQLIYGTVKIIRSAGSPKIDVKCTVKNKDYSNYNVRFVIKNGAKYANAIKMESSDQYMSEIESLGFIQAWKYSHEASIFKVQVFSSAKNSIKRGHSHDLYFYSFLNEPVKFGNVKNLKNDFRNNAEVMKYARRKQRNDIIIKGGMATLIIGSITTSVAFFLDYTTISYISAGVAGAAGITSFIFKTIPDKNMEKALTVVTRGAREFPEAVVSYKLVFTK